jgi:hypothetical protein
LLALDLAVRVITPPVQHLAAGNRHGFLFQRDQIPAQRAERNLNVMAAGQLMDDLAKARSLR